MLRELGKRISGLYWSILHIFFPAYGTKILYKKAFHDDLDFKNPKTINEKLQWLKINAYYNNPLITRCADKYAVRDYMREKGWEMLLPDLYDVCDMPVDMKWDEYPNRFVVKCNHGCGYNIICDNKELLDIEDCKDKLRKWLKEDYWKIYGEHQYRFIKKRIIVEEYLGKGILTYKFYCFNGIPRVMYISFMGENGEKDKYINYYDMNMNRLDIKLYPHENFDGVVEIPENWNDLVSYARMLSEDFPFVRVDLYSVGGKTYLSEFTFLPTGGLMKLYPDGTDKEWGSWLDLSIDENDC